MKRYYFRNLILALFLASIFQSCDLFKKDDEQKPIDQYLVSYEKESSYLSSFILSIMENYENKFPELSPILDKIEYAVTVYKITYITTFNDEEIIASGLVCVPSSTNPLPVLSYQNGTNTLHSNAPSVNPDNELYLMLEFMASTGFVITIPDYLGFGSSDKMFHPYLDKESTVQTIIDMQLAVKEMMSHYLDIELNNDYYIAGYSQGGWSTMQLQKEMEQNYSKEFNLKASACGAGPYDLNYINDYVLKLDNYPMPYFLGYIFNSYYNLNGITTPIDEVFKAPFDSKILTLYDGTKSGTEINNELTTKISLLFTDDYINNYATEEKYSSIKEMLSKNSIPAWKTKIPTMLLHGTNDDFVPTMGTNRMYQGFLSQGVGENTIQMVPLNGKTHSTGIIPSGVASIAWFLELRDGE